MSGFNHIFLVGRHQNAAVTETLVSLYKHLLAQKEKVFVDSVTACAMQKLDPNLALTTLERDDLQDQCDLAIVVGGDGSFLHTATALAEQHIPVLGVNRGRLGFLTDVYPHEFKEVDEVINGDYSLEKRFLLNMKIVRAGTEVASAKALNEVTLLPGLIAHMIEFEIHIDNNFLCSHRADGLITATPTGSTAYALSAGGPIVHPGLDAMVLVPMYPHTLTSRPIVIAGNSNITIKVMVDDEVQPGVSCDGQTGIPLNQADEIHITKNQDHLLLVHPRNYNYFGTLRSKLYWGKKL